MIIRMTASANMQEGSEAAWRYINNLFPKQELLRKPKYSKPNPAYPYFKWREPVEVEGNAGALLCSFCDSERGVWLAAIKGTVSAEWWAKACTNDYQQYLGTHPTMEDAQKVAENFARDHLPIIMPEIL